MMATSADNDATSTSSPNESNNSSPTDTTRLMSNGSTERRPNIDIERWVFSTPRPGIHPNVRRFHSPRIYSRPQTSMNSPSTLVRSVSEDVGINARHWHSEIHRGIGGGPPLSSSMVMSVQQRRSPVRGDQESSPLPAHNLRYQRPSGTRPDAQHFRTSSTSDVGSSSIFRTASILSDIRPGSIIRRSSTRRSFGREWTRSHWEKVRDLEQDSERARRCSKLSSGFAPLMVFGGLVFICIGISATTNTGKDREKLQKLSAAPMAMGVFMLALGFLLIVFWFGCRGRAKNLEQQLLHGSRRNSADDNLMQNFISKLYSSSSGNRRQTSSPTLPGVTLDGVDVLTPQTDKEVREQQPSSSNNPHETEGCCSRCGAANAATHVVLETSI